MPVYQYEGNHYSLPDGLSPEEAKNKILTHLGRNSIEPVAPEGTYGGAIKSAFAETGNAVDTGVSMLAGTAASMFDQTDDADKIYKEMEERNASRRQWANPDNAQFSTEKKVAGVVATLPQQIPSFFLSPFSTGKTALDSGESLSTALKAVGIDTAGNMVGAGLGPMGKGIVKPIVTGAAVNAGQDYATKALIQQLMETKKGKEAFDPTLEDALVSGVVGGGFGAHTSIKNRKLAQEHAAVSEKVNADIEALKAQKEQPVLQNPIDRNVDPVGWEKRQFEIANKLTEQERLAPTNEERQGNLFDQSEEGRMRNPTEAVTGDWRIDENGMPIKVDLSMEAQNLQEPLQRNLWGDELSQKHEQEAPRSLTEAIDSMDWAHRRGAIKKTRLGRELEAPGELKAAKMEANSPFPPPEEMRVPKSQRGGINTKEIKQGLSDLLSDGILKRIGLGMKGVEVYRAIGEGESAKGPREPGNWVTPNKDIAVNVYAKGDASKVVKDYIPARDLYEAHPDGWIYAPKGTDILSMKRTPDMTFGDMLPKQGIRVPKSQRGAVSPELLLAHLPHFVLSKIKDASGKLKLMYHGTSKDVAFKDIKPTSRGAWFTDSPKAASEYAKENDSKSHTYENGKFVPTNTADRVHQVYLNIKNPYKPSETAMSDYVNTGNYKKFQKDITEKAKALGHDGIDWGHGVFTAFNKDQIASAISPTFKGPKSQRGVIDQDLLGIGGMHKVLGKLKPSTENIPETRKALEITGVGKKIDLKEFETVAASPEGVAALAKTAPDVPVRGQLRKGMANLTKGFLYEKTITNNPILKDTYDTWSTAVDASNYKINKLIHEEYLPALRKLSDIEVGSLGKLMVAAMKAEKSLTPEFLKERGYSEAAIDVVQKTAALHEENFKSLNQAREKAKKKPISRYEAYLAGMATGNFKKVIHVQKTDKDGKPLVDSKGAPILDIVGVVGSDFRKIMDSRVKKLLDEHPEYIASEEKYNGVRKRDQDSIKYLQEALAIASDSNPNYKAFVQHMDEVLSGEAYGALGASKHTLAKKGVFGMEGDKPWETDYQNGVDMFNAQVRYTQTMSQWAEYSKAMERTSKVFDDPEVVKQQPNAIKMSKDYIDNILGNNPTNIGKGIDSLIGHIGESTGVGPAVLRGTLKASRNLVNTLFFGLNAPFLIVNSLQPATVSGQMKSFLNQRGIDVNLDVTGLTDLATKGSYSSIKHISGWPETSFEKGMWRYAKEHGIDQTQLIESSKSIRNDASKMTNDIMKLGANAVEAVPRAIMFATMAHMLKDGGYKNHPDIYKVARELTDMAMVDYRHHEQIKLNQQAGMLSEATANLTSFKANTLSRYAFFAREMGKGHSGAFTSAMISALVWGGMMGLPGYEELDYMVTHLSGIMGKATTLSKEMFDLGDKINEKSKGLGDTLNTGMLAYLGLDAHSRLGQGSIMPSITGGLGKIKDIATAGYDAVKSGTGYDAATLARAALPQPISPILDNTVFTQRHEDGTEIALNKHGVGTVVRNDADKLWKRIGMTGIHEAKIKAQNYGVSGIQDKSDKERQLMVENNLQKIMAFNHGNVPKAQYQALAAEWVAANGDPKALDKMIEKAAVNINTSERQRRFIKEKGNSLGSATKLERSYATD